MILDLREFEDFPAEVTINAGPERFQAHSDSLVSVERIEVRLAVQKSGQEYFCQGKVKAQVTLECARCLATFVCELDGPTDFIIGSEESAAGGKDEYDTEDYVFLRGNDFCVDISEPVRQALILAVPLKPLCSEDCRGLCPSCGANLNERSCNCNRERIDARWEGLKDLLPGDETSKGEK